MLMSMGQKEQSVVSRSANVQDWYQLNYILWTCVDTMLRYTSAALYMVM